MSGGNVVDEDGNFNELYLMNFLLEIHLFCDYI